MRLQAQPPLRMAHAIAHRKPGIYSALRPIHGLQKEVAEREPCKLRRLDSLLRIHQLELIAGSLHKSRAGFGTDANPVQDVRSFHGAICLHRYLEIARMQSTDERLIELEQRFASRANNEFSSSIALRRPLPCDGIGDRVGILELSTSWAVDACKIRIAEAAHSGRRDPARGRTRGCIPRIGRRRRHGRLAPLHPEA